jgi:L,D-transpeptidase-like protein
LIRSEQLVSALRRLDPRDREVLDLSLRRRVPDEALAKLYDFDVRDVARRRAAAIERLADDLDVRRGEDLGVVLKGLLEPEIWEATGTPERGGPVLDMLAAASKWPKPWLDRPAVQVGVLAAAGVALLGAAGLVGATAFNGEDEGRGKGAADAGPRRFEPQGSGPLGAPFPSDPNGASSYATAYVPRRKTTLYEEPGGDPAITLTGRTEWGSPRVLGVVGRRGRWLAVQAPELKNGELGWLPVDAARLGSVAYSLHVDLSKRKLHVRRDGKVIRRMSIAVGRPGNSTPTGRFSVTDKLSVTDKASPYGCCVLALSGHQVDLPPGWAGGDRLAVHATTDTTSVGRAVSLGCMRTTERKARWLIKKVPLGAPIFIRR